MIKIFKSLFVSILFTLFVFLQINSCGWFEDPTCNGRLNEYEGGINGDYDDLYEIVKECVSEHREIPLYKKAPLLRCIDAVSCSEQTDNNCILPGVAGRYCAGQSTVLIPCYYSELQEDETAALRLIRHEMIHHLGYQEDYKHNNPVWEKCDTSAVIEELLVR